MNKSYMISWEAVLPMGPGAKHYTGDGPNCKPEEIVDQELWHETHRITTAPWDQYNKLKEWEEEGVELIRNVRLFKRTDPEWEPVEGLEKEEEKQMPEQLCKTCKWWAENKAEGEVNGRCSAINFDTHPDDSCENNPDYWEPREEPKAG